ncbi:MAG: hypothetical protein ACHRXM_13610 [Isosphaerales bacterium]
MRIPIVVVGLSLLLVGQAGDNLDVITLNGHDCPLQGDAKSPDVKDLNKLKGRYHSPVASDIDPTVMLTAMVAPGDDEHRFDVKSAATVTGFVLEVQVGGTETCNCHASDPDQRDTHIALTLSDGAEKNQSVVAEVSPRTRLLRQKAGHNDWTTSALKGDIQGKWVQITGWLLFDFEHIHQAENTNPGGAKNWRATCWEIHPVTSIKVLDSPPDQAFRVAPATVKAFQRAQAEHVKRDPKRKQFVEDRNEKYRRKFADDERDVVENVTPAG